MKKILAAIAVASSLFSGAAVAQSDTMTMDVGLSMLELATAKQFSMLGVTDVDPMSLTLSQLAQIKAVVESSEFNVQQKTQQVQSIAAK